MKKRRKASVLVTIVLTGIWILTVIGCDRRAKYKVLTFFFTGVPPLEEKRQAAVETEEEKTLKAAKIKEEMVAAKQSIFSHPLFFSRQCEACHKASAGFSIPGQKEEGDPIFRKGGGMPGPLVLPIKEICIKCHEHLSESNARENQLWIHAPVGKGECNKCHDPHQSTNPGILIEPPEKLCIQCHREYLAENISEYHNGPKECLSCHTPHIGKDKSMLVKDYKEGKKSVGSEPALVPPIQVPEVKKMLNEKAIDTSEP